MSTGSPCKRRRHHTRRGCTQHQKAQHPTTNAPLSKPICLTVASSSGSTSLSESSDTDTSIAQRGALEQLPCATAAAYATAKTQAAPAAPTNTRAQLGGTRHYARRHQGRDGFSEGGCDTAQPVAAQPPSPLLIPLFFFFLFPQPKRAERGNAGNLRARRHPNFKKRAQGTPLTSTQLA